MNYYIVKYWEGTKRLKILITGANGFLGSNLIAELKNSGYRDLFAYDIDTDDALLDKYTEECDFVFHLAGVNRPKNEEEFMEGNFGFSSKLISLLEKHENKAPILISSSIQAEQNNPYGLSKKAGEDLFLKYSQSNNVNTFVYRLPNLFGKWSRPNYNSVVATFCYNIARGLDIKINDPNACLGLCYIDDVLEEFKKALNGQPTIKGRFCTIPVQHQIKLGELAEKIFSFRDSRENLKVPDMSEALTKKLYSTYLSFLPEDRFEYELNMHCDERGSFTEFLRTPERGQVSVNISRPGVTKGNHWHHTKNEKFLAVSGEGLIRLRKIGSSDIIEYKVSGEKLSVVDIPVGYTHSIVNIGDSDLVMLIWVNECFDPEQPDTYYEEV